MRRLILALGVLLVFPHHLMHAQALRAQPLPVVRPANAPRLPVRRVILYKNGIGYFEHLGKVRGNETVTIDFNSGQLNDVLKSLTALDLGNGRITGVAYNSEAPFAQRLGGLRLPIGEHATLAQLLDALRGARLEVRSGERVATGRLLGVEPRTRGRGDDTTTRDEMTLIAESGEIRTVEITPAVTVKLAERDSSEQVGAYLGLLASTRAQDRRRMTIATSGSGERDVLVSYISEVPVWKTTYRIVLPTRAGANPVLQGWAIVDNTIGEDWKDVELSLVAGAPQSFIQQLSQPLYAQRPVVPLPKALLLTPQTHERTLVSEAAGEAPAAEAVRIAPAAPENRAQRAGGIAGGVAGGVAGGIVAGITGAAPKSRVDMADALQQIVPAADGRDLGDLFEYRLAQPITIERNQSALVPILRGETTAERVSLFNPRTSGGRPLRALWLTNASNLTLDAGSFTVIDGDAFAGEGLIEPMKPHEKRLLSYAVDLGVQVEPRNGDEMRTITRVTIARGVLIQHGEHVMRRVYTVRNNDSSDRRVVIEHPIRPGWKLAEGLTPAEMSADTYRFSIAVPAGRTETLTVVERQELGTRYSVSDINDQQLALIVRESGGDAIRQTLAPIVARRAALAAINTDLSGRTAELGRINEDQARVRENMKALKGTTEEQQLVRRYAGQLNQQEDRVEALRRELDNLQKQKQAAEEDLARAVDALSVDLPVR